VRQRAGVHGPFDRALDHRLHPGAVAAQCVQERRDPLLPLGQPLMTTTIEPPTDKTGSPENLRRNYFAWSAVTGQIPWNRATIDG
jgi:hypothetical protein